MASVEQHYTRGDLQEARPAQKRRGACWSVAGSRSASGRTSPTRPSGSSPASASPPPVPSPLGLHLVITDMPRKVANVKRNAEEGRIVVVRGVAVAG